MVCGGKQVRSTKTSVFCQQSSMVVGVSWSGAAWVLPALGSYCLLREPWMPTCTVTYWSRAWSPPFEDLLFWHDNEHTISVWYGNASNQDCKALQRVVRLAERISGSTLPSLQDIYLKRCKSRAAKIIKNTNHPGNHLFIFLPSGKRFRSMMAKNWETEEELLPSGHQDPKHKLKLGLITFTSLNVINCKTFTILHHCCYVYIPGTTCLHIPLAHPCLYYYLLSPQYTVLHILFHCTFFSLSFLLICILFFYLYLYIYIYIYIYIYTLVLCYIFCTVHWVDLT